MDLEARVHSTHPEALRLWLRMLTCTQLIEKQVRSGLRDEFNTTLPRFDLMAQLERHPQGLSMRELSQRLMVTGGNVTGLTDRLVAQGWVERQATQEDRRRVTVRLTAAGRRHFKSMAREHEDWVQSLMSGLNPTEQSQLFELLGRLKNSLTPAPTQRVPR